MAKVTTIKFCVRNEIGEEYSFKSDVTVNADGEFSSVIPEDMVELARHRAEKDKNVGIRFSRSKHRVVSNTMDNLRKFLGDTAEEYIKCTVTEEVVIAYSIVNSAHYWKGDDGSIYPNGAYADDHTKGRFNTDGKSSSYNEKGYSIGANARVYLKKGYTRGGITEYEYERWLPEGESHLYPKTWAGKLNSFTSLALLKPEDACEIPYTEEGAEFFYNMLLGICKLANRIEQFFGKEENVQRIVSGQNKALPFENG